MVTTEGDEDILQSQTSKNQPIVFQDVPPIRLVIKRIIHECIFVPAEQAESTKLSLILPNASLCI